MIPPTTVVADPNPADRVDRGFAAAWTFWALWFAVVEGLAIRGDARSPDRVKRTLTSFTRWLAATDSVTGIPLRARYGKLRRLALIFLLAWLGRHFARNGEV